MRNHHEKCRDMARSALACRQRKTVHELRQLARRRGRAHVRDDLRGLRRSVGWLDTDDWDHAEAAVGRAVNVDHELAEMVSRRRALDKLGPLVQWTFRRIDGDARLREAGTTRQLDALAPLMPNILAGRHAFDHMELALASRAWWAARLSGRLDRTPDATHDWRAYRVRWLVEHGFHQALNDGIRASIYRERSRYLHDINSGRDEQAARQHLRTRWRPLAGLHDVEAFVADTRSISTVDDVVRRLHGVATTGS